MEKSRKETDEIRSLHPQLIVLEKKSIQKVYMLFKIGQIITEIARLFFSYTCSYGWKDSIQKTRKFLLAWRIKWEEYVDPNASILQHVVGKSLQTQSFTMIFFSNNICIKTYVIYLYFQSTNLINIWFNDKDSIDRWLNHEVLKSLQSLIVRCLDYSIIEQLEC